LRTSQYGGGTSETVGETVGECFGGQAMPVCVGDRRKSDARTGSCSVFPMVQWLNDNAGFAAVLVSVATLLVTAFLVGVTWHYANTTRKALAEAEKSSRAAEGMVEEMRAARAASFLPKIGVDLQIAGIDHPQLRITNVGVGPAIDVDLTLACEPHQAGAAYVRTWRAPLLVPGESRLFDAATVDYPETDGTQMRMDEFGAAFAHVTVTGHMRDAFGTTHEVDEVIEYLAEWWTAAKAAHQLRPSDPADRIASAVGRASDNLRGIERALRPLTDGSSVRSFSRGSPFTRIAQALERISPPPAVETTSPEAPPGTALDGDSEQR
jgi:hypothetical protein